MAAEPPQKNLVFRLRRLAKNVYDLILHRGIIAGESSVSPPHDRAAMFRAKVASGEYASESEMIRNGLRALQARDRAIESRLRGEVANSYDELANDSTTGIPAAEIMARLRASYRERVAKTGA